MGCIFYPSPSNLILLNYSSVQFSHSVMSDSLRPHKPQHARPPCPSPTPGVNYMYRKREHVCVHKCMCVCRLLLGSQGVEYQSKRPFSLSKPPFHIAHYLYWTLPFLCLRVLWLIPQECTCTNLSFSTRGSLGTPGKRKSLSLGLQGPCRVTLVERTYMRMKPCRG